MSLGKKIQSLRKKQGLSQEELAERLVVTRQTISKWELEQSTPELQYISQISEIFGVTTDYLIKDNIVEPDPTGKENDDARQADQALQIKKHQWRFLGIVLMVLGLIIVNALIVSSIVHPWETVNDFGHFTGLFGYLFGTGSTFYFIIGCLLLLLGITIYYWNIYPKK